MEPEAGVKLLLNISVLYMIREGKVFIENKTKVASEVGCSERAVMDFRELLFKSNKNKFSFRRVESEKIGGTCLRRKWLWKQQ